MIPPSCPKCGKANIMEYGCSRRGFRRYGGVLNSRNEPTACRRNDFHRHYYCMMVYSENWDHITGCGHRWTR